jgi:hypothetical protein
MRLVLSVDTVGKLRSFVFEHRYSPARAPGDTRLTVSRLCELIATACLGRLTHELVCEDTGRADRVVLLGARSRGPTREVGVAFDPGLCEHLDLAALDAMTCRGRRDILACGVEAMIDVLDTPGAHELDAHALLDLFASRVPAPPGPHGATTRAGSPGDGPVHATCSPPPAP